jgi:hypothetical protein
MAQQDPQSAPPDPKPGRNDSQRIQIIVAVIGLIGVLAGAYFAYLQATAPVRESIKATQTAEAKAEARIVTQTAIALATPFVTPMSPTPVPTEISTSTPTFTRLPPTDTPAPVQPPVFVSKYVYSPGDIQLVEFSAEPNILPTETITDFLKLSRVAFGVLDDTEPAFNIRLVIKNTGAQPLLVDLDQRFFSLEDDQGRAVELIYFCCPAKGDMLAPGQEREIQLMFRSGAWYGKEVSASAIFFRVRGFLPVVRALWSLPTLATAD